MAWILAPDNFTLVWDDPSTAAPAVPTHEQKALRNAIKASGGAPQSGPSDQVQNAMFVNNQIVPTAQLPDNIKAAVDAQNAAMFNAAQSNTRSAPAPIDPTQQSLLDAFRVIDPNIFGDMDPNKSMTRDLVSQLYGAIDPGKSGDVDRLLKNLGDSFTLNQFLSDANLSGLSARSLQDYLQIAADLTNQSLDPKQLALPKPKQHGGNLFSDLLLGGATGFMTGPMNPFGGKIDPLKGIAQKWASSGPGRAVTDVVLSLLASWATGGFSSLLGEAGAGLGVLGGLTGHGLVEAGQKAGLLSFPQAGNVRGATPGQTGIPGVGDSGGGSGGGDAAPLPTFTPSTPQEFPTGAAAGVSGLGPKNTTLDAILSMLASPNTFSPQAFQALLSLAGNTGMQLPQGVPMPTQPPTPAASATTPKPIYAPGINFGGNVAYPTGTATTSLSKAPAANANAIPSSPIFSGGSSK